MNNDCLKCNPPNSNSTKSKKVCYCNLKTRELTPEEKTAAKNIILSNQNISDENKQSLLKALETTKLAL
jgi:hypothetical protein